MTALTSVLLLVESPTLGGNLFSFSECHRVQAKLYSPQDSDAPEKNTREDKELMRDGGSGPGAKRLDRKCAVPAEPHPQTSAPLLRPGAMAPGNGGSNTNK